MPDGGPKRHSPALGMRETDDENHSRVGTGQPALPGFAPAGKGAPQRFGEGEADDSQEQPGDESTANRTLSILTGGRHRR